MNASLMAVVVVFSLLIQSAELGKVSVDSLAVICFLVSLQNAQNV